MLLDNSSSSILIKEKKIKGILALGEGPADGLDDTTITVKGKYSVIITKSRKKICFSFLYVNVMEIYQFKAKDSEIKAYPLCFENIFQNTLQPIT